MALSTHQQNHMAAWEASKLTQAVYCHQHKLNSKTFSNWVRIYRSQQIVLAAPTLIPVEIKSKVPQLAALCLRFPQGHTLELPADLPPQWLGELLKCLD